MCDFFTLLGKGLDPDTTGPKAQTPLHLAAQCNRPELVDLLLKAGAQVIIKPFDGLTPLHVASQQGHADPVIRLLQGKADPGVKDRLGRTALRATLNIIISAFCRHVWSLQSTCKCQ
uniref:Uncharacterized protein n=1 Tax=Sparus aurata TaxID=8175 RepID=A0A671V3S8_SPAAU